MATAKKKVLSVILALVLCLGLLPVSAFAEEGTLTCTMDEHTHSDACYALVEGHTHDDSCYTMTEGHQHTDSCYQETEGSSVLTCENTDAEHVHDASCYTVSESSRQLICGQNESASELVLACGLEESESSMALTCTLPEHTHDSSCYTSTPLDIPAPVSEPEIQQFHFMNRNEMDAYFMSKSSYEEDMGKLLSYYPERIQILSENGGSPDAIGIDAVNYDMYNQSTFLIGSLGDYIQPAEVTGIKVAFAYWYLKDNFWLTCQREEIVIPYSEFDVQSYEGENYIELYVPGSSSIPKTYTVTFDSQGGTDVEPKVLKVLDGSLISAPEAPSKTNCDFGGWYQDEDCTTPWNFSVDTVTDDITLYAKWTLKEDDSNNSSFVRFYIEGLNTEPYTVSGSLPGLNGSLSVKAGYVYLESQEIAGVESGKTDITLNDLADAKLTESFDSVEELVAAANKQLSADSQLKADDYTGFTYDNVKWEDSDNAYHIHIKLTEKDVTPPATQYTVTYQYTGTVPTDAPALPEVSSYSKGQTVSVAAAPTLPGYTFSGWTSSDVTISNGSFTMPEKTVTLTGSWTKEDVTPPATQYTVTYQYTGTVPTDAPTLPRENSYNKGETVSVAAAPTLSGYTFSGWTSSDVTISNGSFTMPEKTVTLTGSWSKNSSGGGTTYYTVTVNYLDQDGNTIASSHNEQLRSGSHYDVSAYDAIEVEGYTYDRTTGDGLTGTMNGNKVINVYYTAEETDLEDEDVPQGGLPEDIEDPDVPTGELPDGTEGSDGSDIDLSDEDVPLANVPETGDISPLWICTAAVSGLSVICLVTAGKKRKDEEV